MYFNTFLSDPLNSNTPCSASCVNYLCTTPDNDYEKMSAVCFLSNALQSKIFKKANGCRLKDRRKAGSRFVYSAKIFHHQAILCHLCSVIFNLYW